MIYEYLKMPVNEDDIFNLRLKRELIVLNKFYPDFAISWTIEFTKIDTLPGSQQDIFIFHDK